MITIRRATIKDSESISFLGKKTFDESFGYLFNDRRDLIGYLDATFSSLKIKNSIDKSHNIYWLVVDDDLPIGYAKLQLNAPSEFINDDKVCKLQKIYFLKSYVSQGIGSRLQEEVFNLAIKQGYTSLWLSVLKENEKAISFYERKNYKIVGEHLFTIGKQNFDFWVMAIQLS